MSGSGPWLSIVMPVLDEEAGIVAALQGLQPWRDAGAEIIVVDGGSSDATVQHALPLADAVIPAPRGRALQMNTGAAASRGVLLLFLHADTTMPIAGLERLRTQSGKGPGWGRFDVRLDSTRGLLRLVQCLMNLRSRWSGIATGDQAIFVTRDLFEALGGYAGIPLMEDIELSTRLLRHSRPVCFRDQVTTAARRWEQGGIIRTIALMWIIRLGFHLGVSPWRLAAWYRQVR